VIFGPDAVPEEPELPELPEEPELPELPEEPELPELPEPSGSDEHAMTITPSERSGTR